jgi:hypothetical protein
MNLESAHPCAQGISAQSKIFNLQFSRAAEGFDENAALRQSVGETGFSAQEKVEMSG